MTKGLAPQTSELFDAVTRLDCIKPFVLVGGTALSLQLNARQSEDLDFMRWKQGLKDKLEVGWPNIKKELSTIGTIESEDILGFDHVQFEKLSPIYDVTPTDIQEYIKAQLKERV